MRVGNLKMIALAASVAFAAGCSSTSTNDDSGAMMDKSGDTGSVSTSGAADNGMSSGGLTKADVMSLSSVFYFDFDKTTVKPEAFADLSAHAKYLVNNPSAKLVLEGHADERGTREYNIALGERRAKAVSRYLSVQGVSAAQMEVVSYGEESPAMEGHNEASWSKNRRVELKY